MSFGQRKIPRREKITQSDLEQNFESVVNMNTLEVSPLRSYGRIEYRPESETARLFCELLGQKNLTQGNIAVIKRLGLKVILKGGEL